MANVSLRDALVPLAARMSRVVREHEILRVTGGLPEKDPDKIAEIARNEILRWAQKRCGGQLPKKAWSSEPFDYFSGGRNSSCVRIQSSQSDIWAMRADDPDRTVPERIWTTEVVVGLLPGQQPQFSARLLVGTPEVDLDIEPHTPGFVQQVAETCGLTRGAYKLTHEPWIVDCEDDVNKLVERLIDQDRKLPIFVLTIPPGATDSAQTMLNATVLGRAMLGIGLVVVLQPAFTWVLSDHFGKTRSVFGGAARAYLPGFSQNADPYSHRLFIAERIASADGAAQCERWMRWLAAEESIRQTSLGTEVLTFSVIRNASLELHQKELEQEGATDSELLEATKVRVRALEMQIEDEKSTQEYFSSEHRKAEERAETAEGQARASTYRIQQLLEKWQVDGAEPASDAVPPDSWSDLLNWCDVELAGQLVLTPSARRTAKSPQFEDVQLVARCLLWLANICRTRRLKGGEGTLREETVEDGIRNSPCGTDAYDFKWQERQYTADWHIKNGGNTRSPLRCLRIYYCWDSETRQIIVSDFPAHRRTGAS